MVDGDGGMNVVECLELCVRHSIGTKAERENKKTGNTIENGIIKLKKEM